MGIVCPGGQKVGDQKSRDQMGSGPNTSQPISHGIFYDIGGHLWMIFKRFWGLISMIFKALGWEYLGCGFFLKFKTLQP
jgi:hypothetical protein